MNSFNHYAYGAIGDWLYRVVAGIQPDPAQPGYRHILLRPRPGGRLTWAKASYESAYGPIASGWKRTEGGLEWEVSVPPNTTATRSFRAWRAKSWQTRLRIAKPSSNW